ncbi:MAG: hypothetical protein M1838_004721 [Thelocarpon superellum]|nr:MAG: hypothetical protein M1838_004721 [Thelocarpon superellum]
MSALLRDSGLGQLIRLATKNKVLLYPEERADWRCPKCYVKPTDSTDASAEATGADPSLAEKEVSRQGSEAPEQATADATPDTEKDLDIEPIPSHTTALSRMATREGLHKVQTRQDLERAYSSVTVKKEPTRPIVPEKLDDGTILVDWYDTDDPENPQNWSSRKKYFVTFQICLYTLVVYMGSAIYTPSITGLMEQFGISGTLGSLGLSMYVLAYGIGPMLWSPLSEIPSIGRNPPYLATFAVFVILCVPAALVNNFAGLMVLRFLLGFFGSPCLATGGASLGDLYSLIKLPYSVSLWALFATGGPALGPIISGFSVPAENWRWSLWEMLWMAGPTFLLLFSFLPETSGSNILLRRAGRLRKLTGNDKMKSQSEIDQANMSPRDTALFYLWKPWQITILDPAVTFTSVYVSLVYGIFYSFFEVFPLVYPVMYDFNVGETGLAFLAIPVASISSVGIYWAYLWYIVEPDLLKNGLGDQERRLIPALFSSFLVPIGLFMFAWLANPSIHWMGTVVALALFTVGVFIILQCIFIYLPLTYPQYAASLFAANDFCRSSLAAAAIIFAHPLYANLGVGKGLSILASLTCACIGGIFILFFYGKALRARSRFTVK